MATIDAVTSERAAARDRIAAKQREEKQAMRAHRKRLGKRAAIGADWDGRGGDNDNIAWPLAKALLAEGNTELLKAAMAYRRCYEQAKSEAMLGGKGVALGNGVALDQRTWIKPNGEIAYKGVRQVARGSESAPARRKVPTDSEKVEAGYTNVPRIWRGDLPVNNMIDAQRKLAMLQARIGAILEPFELAVIDGKTLAEVGNATGIANRSGAQGAGRAIVHMGLIAVRNALGPIKPSDLVEGIAA